MGPRRSPIRIVVLPFYTEVGVGCHWCVSRYIDTHLERQWFEVISLWAHRYTKMEYNRLRERPREESPLAALELTRRFAEAQPA